MSNEKNTDIDQQNPEQVLKEDENPVCTEDSPAGNETAQNSADEAIFEDLARKKKKKKKRLIITIVVIVAVILIAAIIAVIFLRRRVNQMTLNIGDVVSSEATTGSISTTVSGYGSLAYCNEEEITVPADVTVEEVVVSANDALKKGDTIALVNKASVMAAMSALQDELDDLDLDITSAKDDYVYNYIYSNVYGRVKKLYVERGDDIAQVMYDHGAVALVSLDGYMAFDVVTDQVTAGDSVVVVRDDEKKTNIKGTVDFVSLGTATILVKDTEADYGEKLTLLGKDGKELGSGEAYIHNQMKLTGTGGIVSEVYASVNTQLGVGSCVCYMKEVPLDGTYNTLLEEREDKEETMNELIRIYQDGALTAPYDCRISTVDYDEDTVTEGEETSIVTITDDKKVSVTINVDEANILSLELGQSATVTISSIGDEEFQAELTEIDKTATSSSGVTKYTATVEMDKLDSMISGMTASVVIRIQGVENAVIVPVEALHQTSSTSYVYTTYDESTGEFGGRKDVEVGIQNSSYVEITSGLKEGETVYYTETENSAMTSMMGGMPGGGDFSGGDFSGGGDFGGGGGMPGGGGGMPGGGGGMPGGRG